MTEYFKKAYKGLKVPHFLWETTSLNFYGKTLVKERRSGSFVFFWREEKTSINGGLIFLGGGRGGGGAGGAALIKTMITYISSANDTNYTHYTELLLATKIVHSKDNEIARKHHRDQII